MLVTCDVRIYISVSSIGINIPHYFMCKTCAELMSTIKAKQATHTKMLTEISLIF